MSSRTIGEGYICYFGWQVLSQQDRSKGGMLLRVVKALLHYWWNNVGTIAGIVLYPFIGQSLFLHVTLKSIPLIDMGRH